MIWYAPPAPELGLTASQLPLDSHITIDSGIAQSPNQSPTSCWAWRAEIRSRRSTSEVQPATCDCRLSTAACLRARTAASAAAFASALARTAAIWSRAAATRSLKASARCSAASTAASCSATARRAGRAPAPRALRPPPRPGAGTRPASRGRRSRPPRAAWSWWRRACHRDRSRPGGRRACRGSARAGPAQPAARPRRPRPRPRGGLTRFAAREHRAQLGLALRRCDRLRLSRGELGRRGFDLGAERLSLLTRSGDLRVELVDRLRARVGHAEHQRRTGASAATASNGAAVAVRAGAGGCGVERGPFSVAYGVS